MADNDEEREVCSRCGYVFPTLDERLAGQPGRLMAELADDTPVCEECYTTDDLKNELPYVLDGVAGDIEDVVTALREGRGVAYSIRELENRAVMLREYARTLFDDAELEEERKKLEDE